MKAKHAKRSKDKMFNVVLTDAVASTYVVPGLCANKPVNVATLRMKLDAAGLLKDATGGGA